MPLFIAPTHTDDARRPPGVPQKPSVGLQIAFLPVAIDVGSAAAAAALLLAAIVWQARPHRRTKRLGSRTVPPLHRDPVWRYALADPSATDQAAAGLPAAPTESPTCTQTHRSEFRAAVKETLR